MLGKKSFSLAFPVAILIASAVMAFANPATAATFLLAKGSFSAPLGNWISPVFRTAVCDSARVDVAVSPTFTYCATIVGAVMDINTNADMAEFSPDCPGERSALLQTPPTKIQISVFSTSTPAPSFTGSYAVYCNTAF